MKKTVFIFIFVVLLGSGLFAEQGTRFLHEPDIHLDKIVFVHANDLWLVSAEGGVAKRLTSHKGMESNPKFSPDGKWIAFSGQYDGNTGRSPRYHGCTEVYVIPAEGGVPKRLTFHPARDVVQGWSVDGKVLFTSLRYSRERKSNKLFAVSPQGDFPEELPLPRVEFADASPDGAFIAYNPIYQFWQPNWRRYRGGTAPPVWIISLKDYSHVEIPRDDSNDMYPAWIGERVYFLSDRNRSMNLFSYDTKSGKMEELVDHGASDIKYLSSGPEKLVYGVEGYLFTFDPSAGQSSPVSIQVPSDHLFLRPRFKNVAREIVDFDLSPSGNRALFEAHGDVLTVPAEKGEMRNLTQSPGAMDRFPAWSPDGKWIAYFSDAGGEYALYVADQMGEGSPKKIALEDPTFFYSPVWSPDSKKIAFTDKHLNLWFLDVGGEQPEPVKVDEFVAQSSHVWSPDSQWLAYQRYQFNRFGIICVYSLEKAEEYQITDGMSDASSPVFDREGKYLFFLASTNTGPIKSPLDMSSRDTLFDYSIYVTVLRKDLPSPFAPESDEEAVEGKEAMTGMEAFAQTIEGGKAKATDKETDAEKERKEKDKNKEEFKKRPAEKPFRIDLENIGQRILSLPVKAKLYTRLASADGRALFYLESAPIWNGDAYLLSGAKLWKYDFKARKTDVFLSKVMGFQVSADGKKLLYRSGNDWAIIPTAGKPKPGDGKIDLTKMEIRVDPQAEWAQMFHEAWRLNRDFIYAPNMHGVDWAAIHDKYAQYVPDLSHRSDLNYLMSVMLGELCLGHSYVRGGDFPEIESVSGGLLGADYEIVDGYYRIKKVYRGLNWNPDLRSPLTEPGVNVKEGEYILKVNGQSLKSPTNIYAFFEGTLGKQVILSVNDRPTEEGARAVTVVPIGDERGLRHRAWVEGNRKKVEEMSGGRIGYVFLPDTALGGWTYFHRYFYAQLDKEGLVIDERYNDGGQAANHIIDTLAQPLLNYWAPREGPDYTTPFGAVFGPKAMIINEYAGSGGDAMPYYFRKREVGPLVGKRTWGGLVGIGGTPRLMDGGYVTAPGFAFFDTDGKWDVENIGVAPDYDVEQTPAEIVKGRDPQLEKAVELVLEALRKNPFKRAKRPPYPKR
jgi:tricorn protease